MNLPDQWEEIQKANKLPLDYGSLEKDQNT